MASRAPRAQVRWDGCHHHEPFQTMNLINRDCLRTELWRSEAGCHGARGDSLEAHPGRATAPPWRHRLALPGRDRRRAWMCTTRVPEGRLTDWEWQTAHRQPGEPLGVALLQQPNRVDGADEAFAPARAVHRAPDAGCLHLGCRVAERATHVRHRAARTHRMPLTLRRGKRRLAVEAHEARALLRVALCSGHGRRRAAQPVQQRTRRLSQPGMVEDVGKHRCGLMSDP